MKLLLGDSQGPSIKVSIIIPVYNVAPYVEECIRSVMKQTLTEGVECIIVDDCGQDNSMEIVEGLVVGYDGNIVFRILHHDHNRGLSAARNTGIDVAKGKWLFFVDSDDEIAPKGLELLINKTVDYPVVNLVQGYTSSVPVNDLYKTDFYNKMGYVEGDEWIIKNYLKPNLCLPCQAWNKLVRKEFVKANGIYFKEGLIHEDHLWSFHLYKKLKSIAFVEDTTYIHYRRDCSIMTGTHELSIEKNESWGIILYEMLKYLNRNEVLLFLDKYKYEFYRRYRKRSFLYQKILIMIVWKLCCGMKPRTLHKFLKGWYNQCVK